MSEDANLKIEDLQQRVSLVINECIRRRAGGEVIADESLIEAHPDLMPELAERLRFVRMIEAARYQEILAQAATDLIDGRSATAPTAGGRCASLWSLLAPNHGWQ